MNLIDTLGSLKNALKFDSNKKIKKGLILKILEAARWAPSAGNQQVWRFISIDDNEKIKFIREAIKDGDPRLIKRLSVLKKIKEENVNKASFRFDESYFNVEQDMYQSEMQNIHRIDVLSAQSAPIFIICCHSNRLTGKVYGETEMGAAIINMILVANEMGLSTRWIRIFNREYVREQFQIPKHISIDAILALGFSVEFEENISEKPLYLKYFLSHNLWENPLKIQQDLLEKTKQKEYNLSTIDAILDRRSIRNYHEGDNYKISLSNMYKIAKSGLYIPLIINKPYIKIIAIDNPKLLSKIANSAKMVFVKQSHVQQVPLIILVAFETKNSTALYAKIDAGAITQLILLRSYSLRIGTCWVGSFSRKKTKEIIKCPNNWHLCSLIVLGYSKNYPKPPPRIGLGKLCSHNYWNKSIVKHQKTLNPKSNFLSILMRNILKPNVKTLLRDIDVGCKNPTFLLQKLK